MNREEFLREVEKAEVNPPIWKKMQESRYPFVIWGTGSLSYSIKKYMDLYRIKVTCYWVDGDHEKEKDGIPVYSFSEVLGRYEKFNVVFGHSQYERKRKLKEKYQGIQNIFCIPNVCYNRYQKMEKKFFQEKAEEYYQNFDLLEDEISKECMTAYLKCKISENVDDIIDVFQEKDKSYFENTVITLQKDEVYVDVGAYTGDSLELFLKAVHGKYEKIYAWEPDENYADILRKYVEKQKLERVVIEQKGTWNQKDTLCFHYDEESSGISFSESENLQKIEVDTLDHMLEGEKVTFVKINFLEGVKETIEGMQQMLLERKPKLAVTVGFDEYALLRIPVLIKRINPDYKLYLRFIAAMPARLLLFAV